MKPKQEFFINISEWIEKIFSSWNPRIFSFPTVFYNVTRELSLEESMNLFDTLLKNILAKYNHILEADGRLYLKIFLELIGELFVIMLRKGADPTQIALYRNAFRNPASCETDDSYLALFAAEKNAKTPCNLPDWNLVGLLKKLEQMSKQMEEKQGELLSSFVFENPAKILNLFHFIENNVSLFFEYTYADFFKNYSPIDICYSKILNQFYKKPEVLAALHAAPLQIVDFSKKISLLQNLDIALHQLKTRNHITIALYPAAKPPNRFSMEFNKALEASNMAELSTFLEHKLQIYWSKILVFPLEYMESYIHLACKNRLLKTKMECMRNNITSVFSHLFFEKKQLPAELIRKISNELFIEDFADLSFLEKELQFSDKNCYAKMAEIQKSFSP